MEKRFWELDALRGAAVLGMVAFHAVFDLNYFAGVAIDVSSGFWWMLARAVATAFVLVSGAVLAISYGKISSPGFKAAFAKFLPRSMRIFALAMLVTVATYLFLSGNGTIWFGILHFIAIGSLLALPFLGMSWQKQALAGILFIALGFVASSVIVQTPYLFWLGLQPIGFYTFDYFPLFPWLGVMLLGAAVGTNWYARRKPSLPPQNALARSLAFLGRHSLATYFIHQPLLIGAIMLAG